MAWWLWFRRRRAWARSRPIPVTPPAGHPVLFWLAAGGGMVALVHGEVIVAVVMGAAAWWLLRAGLR